MQEVNEDILTLADQLHSGAIHLLRWLRTEDRVSGVGPAQLSALSVLVFGGAMSLKRLAAIEQVKPPTMVRIVQALVYQKLAASETDATDARKVRITATGRGRALMLRARKRRVEKLARALGRRQQAELRDLQRALSILAAIQTSEDSAAAD